jgi:hypothetical protein
VSPVGLAIAAICFVLPFLTASCDPVDAQGTVSPEITYTGADMVFGGTGDIRVPRYEPGGYRLERADDTTVLGRPQDGLPVEPFAVLAWALIAAGIAATAIPTARLRAIASAGTALLAGLAVIAATERTRLHIADLVEARYPKLLSDVPGTTATAVEQMTHIRYGYWTVLALLVLVGLGNVAVAVPAVRKPTRAAADAAPP